MGDVLFKNPQTEKHKPDWYKSIEGLVNSVMGPEDTVAGMGMAKVPAKAAIKGGKVLAGKFSKPSLPENIEFPPGADQSTDPDTFFEMMSDYYNKAYEDKDLFEGVRRLISERLGPK